MLRSSLTSITIGTTHGEGVGNKGHSGKGGKSNIKKQNMLRSSIISITMGEACEGKEIVRQPCPRKGQTTNGQAKQSGDLKCIVRKSSQKQGVTGTVRKMYPKSGSAGKLPMAKNILRRFLIPCLSGNPCRFSVRKLSGKYSTGLSPMRSC